MKKTVKLILITLSAAILAACSSDKPGDGAVKLRFHEDGTFRIMQVTDTHVDWDRQNEYKKVYDQLCDMLDEGRPDLVVFTGDIVTESAGGDTPWQEFLKPLDERNIPFALTYGNHDRENVLMDSHMAELITAHPSCVTKMASGCLDDTAIEILSPDGARTEAVLYVMDSGDYSTVVPFDDYGWFPMSQLEWYDKRSKAYTMANDGCPVPSYMFFHIPLCEFGEAFDKGLVEGARGEDECPGRLNSGMFALIKNNADVHGVFVGHDHVNDYIADAGNVAFVYGCFSGDATTYTHERFGSRFIELKEGDYGFRSWIRERSGETVMDRSWSPDIDYTLHKACGASGTRHGVEFSWYDGAESLAAMEMMEVPSEIVPMPRHETRHSEGPHGFSYKGLIYVPETGLWRFRTGDRENGRVCIDDVELSTSYKCNVTEINLEKGFHLLDVMAWTKGGRSDFKLTWMAPGTDRLRDVPEECFFVNDGWPYQNPALSTEERIDNLMSLLTTEEKISMLFATQPEIKRIGLPKFSFGGEACHGLTTDGVTVFPQAIALAATFDAPQQQEIFSAVSDEARARWNMGQGGLSFWCPNINIVRDPRWGRGQETYGEDPYLTAVMGSAVVRGMQGDNPDHVKTNACAKHFAVHSGPEPERHRYNPSVSDRDLWETYLPGFKALVKDAGVKEVMCAYTRFEGVPCCASNKLLMEILRKEWGFDGVVVSDCGAIGDFFMQNHHETHPDAASASAAAVLAGTNIECGDFGGQPVYAHLSESLAAGQLSMDDIEAVLRPALRSRIELGALDPVELSPWKDLGPETVSCEKHTQLALKAARESMTLLANDGTLPLRKDLKKILVVGPNADDTEMQLGNYNGHPTPEHTTSIVEAIRKAVPGTLVQYARGCGHAEFEGCNFLLDAPGCNLKCEFFDNPEFKGAPVDTHHTGYIMLNTLDSCPKYLQGVPQFSARFTARAKNDNGSLMQYVIRGNGRFRLKVNGRTICEQKDPDPTILWDSVPDMDKSFTVRPGEEINVEIEYVKDFAGDANFYFDLASTFRYEKENVRVDPDTDAVVVVSGLCPTLEGEQMATMPKGFYGGDRTLVELPEVQQELIREMHASGKPVVVVNCSGSAVSFADISDKCNALLQAWYGGQAMGPAVADVLFGDYNPAGRLPVTVYASTDDLPDFLDYNMEGRTYRYYRDEPEFAFGYGLSYTSFEYGKAEMSGSIAKGVELRIPVTNTGSLEGDEVVQVYVRSLDNPVAPIKSLKGFSRVKVKPGETVDVIMELTPEAFETFDVNSGRPAVLDGRYEILYGSSSRDRDLQALSI